MMSRRPRWPASATPETTTSPRPTVSAALPPAGGLGRRLFPARRGLLLGRLLGALGLASCLWLTLAVHEPAAVLVAAGWEVPHG